MNKKENLLNILSIVFLVLGLLFAYFIHPAFIFLMIVGILLNVIKKAIVKQKNVDAGSTEQTTMIRGNTEIAPSDLIKEKQTMPNSDISDKKQNDAGQTVSSEQETAAAEEEESWQTEPSDPAERFRLAASACDSGLTFDSLCYHLAKQLRTVTNITEEIMSFKYCYTVIYSSSFSMPRIWLKPIENGSLRDAIDESIDYRDACLQDRFQIGKYSNLACVMLLVNEKEYEDISKEISKAALRILSEKENIHVVTNPEPFVYIEPAFDQKKYKLCISRTGDLSPLTDDEVVYCYWLTS